MISVLKSKIHRATITGANLNYEGSITIDKKLLDASGIKPYEKVQVVNINNGARFETYVIVGESNEITLNGAAARLAEVGDKVIIIAYSLVEEDKLDSHICTAVFVDNDNEIVEVKKWKATEY